MTPISQPGQDGPSPQIPFERVRSWMFDDALPFWAEHGVDRRCGGFLEEMTLDGRPTDAPFKRVRVIGRQLYVFSHAALLGWREGEALSERAYQYLAAKAQSGGGGWARLLTRQGEIHDPTPDLYDTAFVLFGLAWRYRLTRDEAVLRLIGETFDFVQSRMRGPHGGFWHWLPPAGPRLQNPHMHMFEACLALYEAANDVRFIEQARELFMLFRDKLFDGRTLGERFTQDWRRIPGEEGRVLEPGHHFEWAWILAQYGRAVGEDVAREAKALTAFAERGVDPVSHAVLDAIRDDGAPIRRTSRSWTNTERIKAHLALAELSGDDARAPVAQSAGLLLDRYLAVEPRGSWIDQFDGEGRPIDKPVPASILYHYVLAFSEMLRLEPALRAPGYTP
jgi:mannose/cellobiose epimerase-like protein (N-acyl-D-glucosamine 2-epimerase family)